MQTREMDGQSSYAGGSRTYDEAQDHQWQEHLYPERGCPYDHLHIAHALIVLMQSLEPTLVAQTACGGATAPSNRMPWMPLP